MNNKQSLGLINYPICGLSPRNILRIWNKGALGSLIYSIIQAQYICGETHNHENESQSTNERKNSRPTQELSLLVDILFALLIGFIWNTQVSFSLTTISNPNHFYFCPNAPSLTLPNCCSHSFSLSLSLYLYLLPTLFSPVSISHKYSDDSVYDIIE